MVDAGEAWDIVPPPLSLYAFAVVTQALAL